MKTKNKPNVTKQSESHNSGSVQRVVSLRQVLSILDEYESHYPTDIFPENGTSQDCAGARFARTLIKAIRHDVKQANADISDRR